MPNKTKGLQGFRAVSSSSNRKVLFIKALYLRKGRRFQKLLRALRDRSLVLFHPFEFDPLWRRPETLPTRILLLHVLGGRHVSQVRHLVADQSLAVEDRRRARLLEDRDFAALVEHMDFPLRHLRIMALVGAQFKYARPLLRGHQDRHVLESQKESALHLHVNRIALRRLKHRRALFQKLLVLQNLRVRRGKTPNRIMDRQYENRRVIAFQELKNPDLLDPDPVHRRDRRIA